MERNSENIVLDSNVLFRMLGQELETLRNKIIEICDKIVITTEILKEYKSKCYVKGFTTTILLRKLRDLESLGKIKKVEKSVLEQYDTKPVKPIKHSITRNRDLQDDKFLLAARAACVLCLITSDHYLLSLDNNYDFRIIEPDNYIDTF